MAEIIKLSSRKPRSVSPEVAAINREIQQLDATLAAIVDWRAELVRRRDMVERGSRKTGEPAG